MANHCSECTYLIVDDGDTKDGQFWCDYKKDWKYADSIECYKWCRAYDRSDSKAKSAYDFSKDSQSSSGGCFITTTLCGILSMKDDNEYLNTLRKFRKEILQKNQKGLEILVKYDEVGPKISNTLYQSSGKLNMACILFNNYIIPITDMIKNKEYFCAIDAYIEMTNKLITFFDIDDIVNTKVEEVEPSLSGHGKLVKKLA